MIPSRRRLRERLVPDENLRVVTYGRLVDDSIRGTVAIGLTDRRIVCLSPDDDLVDVDYATISTIRSFGRSRLTFEGVDPRLLIVGFGSLAVLFGGLAAGLAASAWDGSPTSLAVAALVAFTVGAALAALFGGRLLDSIRSTLVAAWWRTGRAATSAHGRRFARRCWAAGTWCGARGRRLYWRTRSRTHGLVLWSGGFFRRGYWWSRSRLSTLSWWIVDRLRLLGRWCRRDAEACYRLYAVRTDRPLAPLAVRLRAAMASAPVAVLSRGCTAGGRAVRRAGGAVGNALRAALSTWRTVRVRPRLRALLRVLRTGRALPARVLRPRLPAVSRPRLATPTRSVDDARPRSRPRRRRRWPRFLAGTIAVGSFAILVAVDPAPAVALALAAAVGCLGVVAYATRLENDCTGVQFSREHETELSIHTVDGDTVRLLLDPETDLDAELSRSAAQVSRTTPDAGRTASAAE